MSATEALVRLVDWAQAEGSVRAIVLLGSRARTVVPADEWSDTDVLIVTTDAARLLSESGWVQSLGTPVLTFTEPTPVAGLRERRVLLDDGTDLDLIPVPVEQVGSLLAADETAAVLARGHRVLVDKDGLLDSLPARVAARPRPDPADWAPSANEVSALILDYLHHCVWITKRLCRGELWRAHGCLQCYQRAILLQFLEWQALARSGGAADTWFEGRFLERWAPPEVVAGLRDAFARYDAADVARALLAGLRLFGSVAGEVAAAVGAEYPVAADRWVTAWVTDRLAGLAP